MLPKAQVLAKQRSTAIVSPARCSFDKMLFGETSSLPNFGATSLHPHLGLSEAKPQYAASWGTAALFANHPEEASSHPQKVFRQEPGIHPPLDGETDVDSTKRLLVISPSRS